MEHPDPRFNRPLTVKELKEYLVDISKAGYGNATVFITNEFRPDGSVWVGCLGWDRNVIPSEDQIYIIKSSEQQKADREEFARSQEVLRKYLAKKKRR